MNFHFLDKKVAIKPVCIDVDVEKNWDIHITYGPNLHNQTSTYTPATFLQTSFIFSFHDIVCKLWKKADFRPFFQS